MPGTRVTVTGVYTIFQNKISHVRFLINQIIDTQKMAFNNCITQKRRGDTGAGAVAIRHPYIRFIVFENMMYLGVNVKLLSYSEYWE